MSNLKSKLDSVKSARLTKAPLPPATNPGDPAPYQLTSVENPDALELLRQGARQEFLPDNPVHDAMADLFAENLWTLQRLGLIHHQSLSLAIEQNYDKEIAKHPNADAAMHTIEAWRLNQSEPALRLAFTDQNPVTNRLLRIMNTLHRIPRRRS